MLGVCHLYRLLTVAYLIMSLGSLHGQPNPAWRHYTVETGLPNNTVYGMCSDSVGRMYFATNSGICRFDGYHFERFPGPDEINAIPVFCPQSDADGRVWFRTTYHKLYYIENDSIKSWQWNSLFPPETRASRVLFSVMPDGSVVLQERGLGFVRVTEDGQMENWVCDSNYTHWAMLPGLGRELNSGFRVEEPHAMCFRLNAQCLAEQRDLPFILHNDHLTDTINAMPYSGSNNIGYQMGLELAPRHYLFVSRRDFCEVRNGKIVRYKLLTDKNTEFPLAKMQILPDGRLALARIENQPGLWIYKNVDHFFAQQPDTVLLRGEGSTMLLHDHDGGTWVSTYFNGVFYLPNPHLGIFDVQSGFPLLNIGSICAGEPSQLYFTTSDHSVYQMDTRSHRVTRLEQQVLQKQTVAYLHYASEQDMLLVGGVRLFGYAHGHWTKFQTLRPNGQTTDVLSNRITPSHDGKYWLSLSSTGVDSIHIATRRGESDKLDGSRFFGVTHGPHGAFWLGNNRGLHVLWPDGLVAPAPDRPELLGQRVRQLFWTRDSVLVTATASHGVCFWRPDWAKQGFFRQVSTMQGMSSEAVNHLLLQGDSVVWAGGNLGLNRISGFRAGQTLRVEQLNVAHGLPSNQINGLTITSDGVLWVATSGGLVQVNQMPMRIAPKAPFLSGLWVNGKKYSLNAAPSLAYDQNNLEFRFYALNFPQNGRIPYRFRIKSDAEWQVGMATTAMFSALSPGVYRFEVQAQNEDEAWSTTTALAFTIAVPWWSSWWFRALVVVVLAAAAYRFYKWRTHRLRAEIKIQRQIADLELSALRAQMNPHFVSNCLSSIQLMVLENRNAEAVRYLAHFGKLTRMALEISKRSTITLEEELNYLNLYLTMEKLRFKDRFNFTIAVAPEIDCSTVSIPSVLIQPLAENAIKHGFSMQKDSFLLEINCTLDKQQLQIEVLDNGRGLPADFDQRQTQETHALAMIQKRLALIGRQGRFVIRNRSDGVSGTRAVVVV